MTEKWTELIYRGENLGMFYEVSNQGRLRNTKTKKVVKTRINERGYEVYCGTINNKYTFFRIHKAVAESFIANIENKPQVCHKDGNKTNNNVENLMWATQEENINYAIEIGLINSTTLEKSHKNTRKPVLRIDNEGNVTEFVSRLEAAKSITDKKENLKGVARHIGECCRNKRKTCGGYIWKEAN